MSTTLFHDEIADQATKILDELYIKSPATAAKQITPGWLNANLGFGPDPQLTAAKVTLAKSLLAFIRHQCQLAIRPQLLKENITHACKCTLFFLRKESRISKQQDFINGNAHRHERNPQQILIDIMMRYQQQSVNIEDSRDSNDQTLERCIRVLLLFMDEIEKAYHLKTHENIVLKNIPSHYLANDPVLCIKKELCDYIVYNTVRADPNGLLQQISYPLRSIGLLAYYNQGSELAKDKLKLAEQKYTELEKQEKNWRSAAEKKSNAEQFINLLGIKESDCRDQHSKERNIYLTTIPMTSTHIEIPYKSRPGEGQLTGNVTAANQRIAQMNVDAIRTEKIVPTTFLKDAEHTITAILAGRSVLSTRLLPHYNHHMTQPITVPEEEKDKLTAALARLPPPPKTGKPPPEKVKK